MDARIIRSLAACALYPYLEGKSSLSGSHDGGKEPNGAEFSDDVAVAVLGVPKGGVRTYHGPDFFSIGFEFGLDVCCGNHRRSGAFTGPVSCDRQGEITHR
jgi:hypothetical protein